MDFVAQRLGYGRWIRILTTIDQFTRECLCLHADIALRGDKVASALHKVVKRRGTPESITMDSGTELSAKLWTYGPTRMVCTWIHPSREAGREQLYRIV